MGFFNFKKKRELNITTDDLDWFEENYNCLELNFKPIHQNFTFSKKFFSNTFSSKNIKAKNLIVDICNLLGLNSQIIELEMVTDFRDEDGVPYEYDQTPFQSELEITNEGYKILLANVLEKYPQQMTMFILTEMLRVYFHQKGEDFNTEEDEEFLLVSGIYLGFGVIVLQNLYDFGVRLEGDWQRENSFSVGIPHDLVAYGLVYHFMKQKIDIDFDKFDFDKDIMFSLDVSREFLAENPERLIKN